MAELVFCMTLWLTVLLHFSSIPCFVLLKADPNICIQNHTPVFIPLINLGNSKVSFCAKCCYKLRPFSQEWFLANTLAQEELNDEQAETGSHRGKR